ncbi:hypothetical protein OTU49_004696 [Cherax quadricarinatus]|uniref:Uncharacterized protein n=1 Tax=Cherax quadricarinatus TaxID=27406 RepID=A0AAW0XAB1_CHEQU
MGRREPEFEVERRRKDRMKDIDISKKDTKGQGDKSAVGASSSSSGGGGDEDGSWTSWAENPRNVQNLKFFIFAQSFVVFLTFGVPQLQKFWSMVMDFFN